MKPLAEIIEIKTNVEDDLMRRPGVTPVDAGYKYVSGKKTEEIAIRLRHRAYL